MNFSTVSLNDVCSVVFLSVCIFSLPHLTRLRLIHRFLSVPHPDTADLLFCLSLVIRTSLLIRHDLLDLDSTFNVMTFSFYPCQRSLQLSPSHGDLSSSTMKTIYKYLSLSIYSLDSSFCSDSLPSLLLLHTLSQRFFFQ